MPLYQVTVEYLVPTRAVVTIEADSLADACERAPEHANCHSDDWAHDDDDDASPIYVTRAALVGAAEAEIVPAALGRAATLANAEAGGW